MGIILILFLLFGHAWSNDTDRVVVNTKRGPIIGNNGNEYYTAYLGVPYAKIDEENPFGNCLEYPYFDTPFDASNFSIKCPQENRTEKENLQCLNIYLTLDIYAPKTKIQLLPVLVWFYGGSNIMGSNDYSGGKYFIQHNIVMLTVNYRVGPYGFLCLDDPSVPGNQGLKDQITALRWIKENIGVFGGDATKVTIAGQSFGGTSVDWHFYSTYENLFDQAIIQSGLMSTDGMLAEGDHEAAAKLSKLLGHNPVPTENVLNFLSKADPVNVLIGAMNLSLQFKPCKEKHFKGVQSFFPHNSSHTQESMKLKDTSILIGYNSKEDCASFLDRSDDFYRNIGNIFHDELEKIFLLHRQELEKLAKIVQAFYLGGKSISQDSMLELCDFTSDIKLNYPIERSIDNYLSQGAGKIYKYLFSYVGGTPYRNISGVGAYHTEELQYLFEMIVKLSTEEQIMMRSRMTEMWANFVKYGDPTPEVTELIPIKWVPMTKGAARPYLNIDVEMKVLDHVNHRRMAFWDLLSHHYRTMSNVAEKRHRRQKQN